MVTVLALWVWTLKERRDLNLEFRIQISFFESSRLHGSEIGTFNSIMWCLHFKDENTSILKER